MKTKALDPETVRGWFVDEGALLQGHFLLSSGLHSPQYLQCALVLARPQKAEALGRALAALLPPLSADVPDLVLSPAMGGLVIGHEVARALGIRAYFTERENGAMTLRRGFALKRGEKVVVVEDVVTTGKSSREVMDLVRARGAEPLALLSIVNRSGGSLHLGVPSASLLDIAIQCYRPQDCVLCRGGQPVVKPGSRPQHTGK